MKKSLVIILCMAGMASAATMNGTTMKDNLDSYIFALGYESGQAFTLSFHIDTISGFNKTEKLLTLDDSYFLIRQTPGYVALSASELGNRNASGADAGWPAATTVDGVNTYSSEGKFYGWISKNSTGGQSSPGAANSTMTFSTDGTNSTITIAFGSNGATEVVNMSGYVLDLTKFALAEKTSEAFPSISDAQLTYGGKAYDLSSVVPEPATATLSLLGLMGLLARRRRK